MMNMKQLSIPNILRPIKNKMDGKDGSSKSVDLSGTINETEKVTEDHFMLRLQEIEDINAHLESLVEQKTNELTEVVATNTKFISIIAHDLRGPFSSILGVLSILKDSLLK